MGISFERKEELKVILKDACEDYTEGVREWMDGEGEDGVLSLNDLAYLDTLQWTVVVREG